MRDFKKMLMKGEIEKEDLQMRADGRIEWVCSHGIGHTVKGEGTHGCDGCCRIFHKKKLESKK